VHALRSTAVAMAIGVAAFFPCSSKANGTTAVLAAGGLTLRSEGRSFIAEKQDFTPLTDLKVLFVCGNCGERPCLRE